MSQPGRTILLTTSGVHFISKYGIAVLAFLMLFLNACTSLSYLLQAGKGQLRILNRARDLNEVIQDPTTPPQVVDLLKKIPEIKKFGEAHGLKPTRNYSEYTKIDHPDSVVHVVTVSEALELKPKVFSFPIAGSFTYIGWFNHDAAASFAADFERQGYDVDLRGASAYSTLGWFRDPILSTMLHSLPEVVNVVLHESVHATLYIDNQSYFNESIASFVADHLTRQYFLEHGKGIEKDYESYEKSRGQWEQVQARFSRAYQDLKQIYSSSKSNEDKLKEKTEYIERLRKDVKIRRKINNAVLIQYQTYDPSDQGFGPLLEKYHGNIAEFLKALSRLKESDFEMQQQQDFKLVLKKVF